MTLFPLAHYDEQLHILFDNVGFENELEYNIPKHMITYIPIDKTPFD